MSIIKKSERMLPFVVVELGNRCDFYAVPQVKKENDAYIVDTNRDMHKVTFNSTKNNWTCTCAYWRWKALDCAGILAAKKYREIHGKRM